MSTNRFTAIDVGFGYDTALLGSINFTANPGDFIAILGKNGSGKTTLLRLLSGILSTSTGYIQCPPVVGWKGNQLPMYCPFIVDEILQLHPTKAGQYPPKKIDEVRHEFDLNVLRHRPLETLSTGEQHRVLTARLFCAHYNAIVIDEPLTALDPRQQTTISQALLRHTHNGGIVIVASHDIHWIAQTCSHAFAITEGKLSNELLSTLPSGQWMKIY